MLNLLYHRSCQLHLCACHKSLNPFYLSLRTQVYVLQPIAPLKVNHHCWQVVNNQPQVSTHHHLPTL